jgi:hypothetical protein
MAAGGFREFVAGETLDEEKINDFLMQGVLVFAGTAARGSAIGTPVEGQFSYLADTDAVEFYDGSAWVEFSVSPSTFDFVIVGGGAGGGLNGGGGGAGGYLSSVSGENSGGGGSAIPSLEFVKGQSFTVSVGAGGASTTSGTESTFGPVTANGGGAGGDSELQNAEFGGSGGGAGRSNGLDLFGRAGIVKQGFSGGRNIKTTPFPSGGGGGASAVGADASGSASGNGGAGVASSITGSAVTRAGGGGGGGDNRVSNTAGSGGAGGGGTGSVLENTSGDPGTVNTGGGGGGGGFTLQPGGAGGSGIIILKYPDTITLSVGAGLTSSTASAGGFKVTQFTGGSDTVTVG